MRSAVAAGPSDYSDWRPSSGSGEAPRRGWEPARGLRSSVMPSLGWARERAVEERQIRGQQSIRRIIVLHSDRGPVVAGGVQHPPGLLRQRVHGDAGNVEGGEGFGIGRSGLIDVEYAERQVTPACHLFEPCQQSLVGMARPHLRRYCEARRQANAGHRTEIPLIPFPRR